MEQQKRPPTPLVWYRCKECGKNLFQVRADAHIHGMQIKCRGCKKIINVSL